MRDTEKIDGIIEGETEKDNKRNNKKKEMRTTQT